MNEAVAAVSDPERDTIVAIATPSGTGALAIVRVSGPGRAGDGRRGVPRARFAA